MKKGFDVTPNELRYRVLPPSYFREETYRYARPEGLARKGIALVVAQFKARNLPPGADPDSMVTQSYRFDRDVWTPGRAKKWIERHTADIQRQRKRVSNPQE